MDVRPPAPTPGRDRSATLAQRLTSLAQRSAWLANRRAHGAAMIELMVALAIGLVVALAALDNARSFSTMSRTQTGSGSALVSGAAAIGALKYDLQMAGLGFYSDATSLCPTLNLYANGTRLANSTAFQSARVNRMADGTDQVEVVYGTAVNAGAGARTMSPMAGAMSSTTVNIGAGITAGQAVMFAAPTLGLPCTVATVSTAVDGASSRTLTFATPARFTPAAWAATFTVAPSYQDSSWISPLGDVVWRRYYVRNDALYMLDVLTNVESLIAEGIVEIRAQYGLSVDAATTTVSAWQDAAGNAALAAAVQGRMRAIRIGVLAVNTQRERPVAAGNCDATSALPQLWAGETVDLTTRANWQCYRYRPLSTVIALRNNQWGQSL